MRFILSTLLFSLFIVTSCTSEYQERLQEAQLIKAQLEVLKQQAEWSNKTHLISEVNRLESEIHKLAKVSGNESLFLTELLGE